MWICSIWLKCTVQCISWPNVDFFLKKKENVILVQLKLTVECIGWLAATTWSPPPLSTTSHYRAKLGQWKKKRNFQKNFQKLYTTSQQRKELSRLTRPMLTFLFQRLSIKFLPISVAEKTILLFVLITFTLTGTLQQSTFTKLQTTFWSKTDHLFFWESFFRGWSIIKVFADTSRLSGDNTSSGNKFSKDFRPH